ncbi:hypothetical protein [Latilactobacillus curvatus]|uniref:hypothetical protein n=1 Tax=Latilactobacillus curvatus TaxID=28038 RepID=UPI000FECA351|nr:hypothetical protein [Latilactobacillus curvatus]QAR35253.1 hypothetical protein EQK21_03985 [Latilactobacillus curvatus]
MRRMVRGARLVDVKRPEYDEPLKPKLVTVDSFGNLSINGDRLNPTPNIVNEVPITIDGQTVATLLYEAEALRRRWL